MNLFIIGAGFTKAALPASPLNCELLDILAQRRPDDSAAAALRDRYATHDIEIALTRLDCDIALSRSAPAPSSEESDEVRLRQRVEKELGDYFSSFSASKAMTQSSWLTELVDEAFTSGDVVISLNYDCVLEGALDWRGKWSPRGGYGFEGPLVSNSDFSTSPVTVLKIHGSACFRSVPYQDKPEAHSVEFVVNERFFPRSGKNKDFAWKMKTAENHPYLIAPSYVKVPRVRISYLMLDALAASAKAKNLVILGSALRPEDGFLTLIVTNFFHQPSWQARRIIIVDPSAKSIGDRLGNYWGVNVSSQIVTMQTRLETSVARLVKEMSSCCRVKK